MSEHPKLIDWNIWRVRFFISTTPQLLERLLIAYDADEAMSDIRKAFCNSLVSFESVVREGKVYKLKVLPAEVHTDV